MIDIRVKAAKLLKEHCQIEVDEKGIDVLIKKGYLNISTIKKDLLKEEYNNNIQPKKRIQLRHRLAEKYCVSVSLVEKAVL